VTTIDVIRLSLFVAGSLLSLIVSWRSLFKIRSHGFFRFLAWEAILALIALNLPHWFSRPFSLPQLFSWTLLAGCMIPLVLGVIHLRKGGTADDRPDEELYGLEKTSQLVTSGIYRYIRHPLYASMLLCSWGAFLKQVTWISALLVVFASLTTLATALADERECTEYFGPQYRDYMKRTKRFIPFLF
jgi:protein-S-isoprenylcysteine O-methyltransferase Ste14